MGRVILDDALPNRSPLARLRRVLVVDDNIDAVESIRMLLELEGYSVVDAYDGEQALQRAAEFDPEIVLMDLGLPRFSGFEVARRLRRAQREGLTRPPLLIAVSGYGREQDRQAARDAGFDLHLTKPADPIEMLRIMAAWCPPPFE